MGEVISTFHVDIRLLIAQAVNFAIVFVVLYYFGIKPLIKILNERSKKVEESLTNAEKIEKELEKTQIKREEVIKKSRQEARGIMEEVERKSEERKKEMTERAKEEIEKIIERTKKDLQLEKQLALREIKEESAGMIIAAMEKILREKLDRGVDKNYIEKVVKDL